MMIRTLLAGILAMLCLSARADTGASLHGSMIWHPTAAAKSVGFRKRFTLPANPAPATLHIFADARYMLWINGTYVLRGPNRFDPKRPEYDSLIVTPYLKAGDNIIEVLVYGHVSNGKTMEHGPGLSLRLEGNGAPLVTDATWRASDKTRFRPPIVSWGDIGDRVDATFEDGDWLQEGYDDSQWSAAVPVSGDNWGAFHTRLTPLLRGKEIPFTITGKTLPFEVTGPATVTLNLQRNAMVYCVLDFDADKGSRLTIRNLHQYTARAGRQTYVTFDSFGSGDLGNVNTVSLTIQVDVGRVKFYGIKVVNLVYPFDIKASFASSDAMLNRFWDVMTYGNAQLSEDGYVDCPWERAEWMGGMDHVYDITRTTYAGPGADGKPVYGDSRLMGKMLMDIGQSQFPDGRVKAHHPSDRYDKHGYIEDYSCVWIWDIKQHYDVTGDKAFLSELWPVVKKQIKLFQDSIKANGLINARDFFIFDNPYAYQICQGATLNAFLYKALRAAAEMAAVMGEPATADAYNATADKLGNAFNTLLWDGASGTFLGKVGGAATLHAAVTALYSGVCSQAHLITTRKWLLGADTKGIAYPWIYNYWFRALYDMDTEAADQQVLTTIRTQFNNTWNANNPGFVPSEANNGGRNFHTYGAVPAYFFGAYMLGVKAELPLTSKAVRIEPRLGDLQKASGTVVTEFGTVDVSWNRSSKDTTLDFSFTIPEGTIGRVSVPMGIPNATVVMDNVLWILKGKAVRTGVSIVSRFAYFDTVAGGSHNGRVQPPSMSVGIGSVKRTGLPVPGGFFFNEIEVPAGGSAIPIRFSLASGSERVRLIIMDARGRLVRTLADGNWKPGEHTVPFDRLDAGGKPVPRGRYLCHASAKDFSASAEFTIGN